MNTLANANLFSRLFDQLDSAARLAIETPEGARISYGDLIARFVHSDRFPALAEVSAAGLFYVAEGPEESFRWGLGRILDGIATLVTSTKR